MKTGRGQYVFANNGATCEGYWVKDKLDSGTYLHEHGRDKVVRNSIVSSMLPTRNQATLEK